MENSFRATSSVLSTLEGVLNKIDNSNVLDDMENETSPKQIQDFSKDSNSRAPSANSDFVTKVPMLMNGKTSLGHIKKVTFKNQDDDEDELSTNPCDTLNDESSIQPSESESSLAVRPLKELLLRLHQNESVIKEILDIDDKNSTTKSINVMYKKSSGVITTECLSLQVSNDFDVEEYVTQMINGGDLIGPIRIIKILPSRGLLKRAKARFWGVLRRPIRAIRHIRKQSDKAVVTREEDTAVAGAQSCEVNVTQEAQRDQPLSVTAKANMPANKDSGAPIDPQSYFPWGMYDDFNIEIKCFEVESNASLMDEPFILSEDCENCDATNEL